MAPKTETPGLVTELPSASRWDEGYSPKELLEQATAEAEDINDIVIVVRYNKTSNQDDTYNILSSSMAMHELMGFIELGKMMSVSSRRMSVDDEPAS